MGGGEGGMGGGAGGSGGEGGGRGGRGGDGGKGGDAGEGGGSPRASSIHVLKCEMRMLTPGALWWAHSRPHEMTPTRMGWAEGVGW
jgi:hypothetical protein